MSKLNLSKAKNVKPEIVENLKILKIGRIFNIVVSLKSRSILDAVGLETPTALLLLKIMKRRDVTIKINKAERMSPAHF